TVALDANPDGATLGGTRTVPIDNGIATFTNLTLNQAGSGYTLTVTVTGTSVARTTGPITVVSAPNATQVFVANAPTTATFGQEFTLEVMVGVVSPGT